MQSWVRQPDQALARNELAAFSQAGRVEIWRGDGQDHSVSRSRSSNRTCGFPASYVLQHIRCEMCPSHLCGVGLVSRWRRG
jgi:hypothetical protein